MPAKRAKASATRQALRARRNGSALAAAKAEQRFVPAVSAASASSVGAVVHQGLVGLAGPVPFEHREFRMVQRAALAVALDMGEA